jgi:hypothetical protein
MINYFGSETVEALRKYRDGQDNYAQKVLHALEALPKESNN